MGKRKFLAAIMAIAMMVTSIKLPPVQVSAEEVNEQSEVMPADESMQVTQIAPATLAQHAKSNSYHPTHGSEGHPSYAFDEATNNMWHSNNGTPTQDNISGSVTETNHVWIQTGFDGTWYLDRMELTLRKNNQIKDYEIYIANSEDVENPVFGDKPIITGEFDENPSTDGADERTLTIDLDGVPATHIRILVKSVFGANGNTYVCAKNIAIYGCEDTLNVDKSELFNVINAAKNVDPNTYCAEDLDNFNAALATAETTYKDYDASQDKVNADAVALLNIITTKREFKPEFLAENAKANSQRDSAAWVNDGPAAWAFDDEGHWWHSDYDTRDEINSGITDKQEGELDGVASDANRIWIQTGFGKEWYVDSIVHTGRSDNKGQTKDYAIYVATGVDSNGEPIFDEEPFQTGILKSGLENEGNYAQEITLDEVVKTTHIRFEVRSTYSGYLNNGVDHGDGHVAVQNLSIFGYDQPAADKTELVTVIKAAEAALNSEEALTYNDEFKADLRAAIDEANSVNNDPSAFQRVVDEARNTLRELMDNKIYLTTLRKYNSTILAENAKANSEQNPVNDDDGLAKWAFDDEEHWWHSRYQNWDQKADDEVTQQQTGAPSGSNPIWIQTGFDRKWNVSYITYAPRSGGNNQIGKYEVSVLTLDDPTEEPPADAVWEVVKIGELQSEDKTHTIDLGKVVEATHVRITAKSKVGGGSGEVTARNISIFGYDKLPEIEVERNAVYDVIAEAEALYNEADRLSEEEGIEEEHVGDLLENFDEVKTAVSNVKNTIEQASQEQFATYTNTITAAVQALRERYLENSKVDYVGNSLTLNGTIDVNFYMTISDEVYNNEKAYMKFTIAGGEDKDPQMIPVKDAKADKDAYVFSYGVPVKDMEAKIKAQMVILDENKNEVQKGLIYTYSVAEYIQYVEENKGNESTILPGAKQEKIEAFTNLVETMSDYGDFASAYWSEGSIEDEEMLAKLENIKATTLDKYAPGVNEVPATREIYYGSSLLLKSNTELRHYFKEQVEVVSVKLGETSIDQYNAQGEKIYGVQNKKGTSLWYFEYLGIGAHQLDEKVTVTVRTVSEQEEIEITYCPLTYAYIVLEDVDEDEELANLMRAMYLYQQAAATYETYN